MERKTYKKKQKQRQIKKNDRNIFKRMSEWTKERILFKNKSSKIKKKTTYKMNKAMKWQNKLKRKKLKLKYWRESHWRWKREESKRRKGGMKFEKKKKLKYWKHEYN